MVNASKMAIGYLLTCFKTYHGTVKISY